MIVLHIGMPKAGSTTVQAFLAENDEALRRLSVDYPRLGREQADHPRAHHKLANQFSGAASHGSPPGGGLVELIPYIGENGHEHTILSSERFCQFSKKSAADLARTLQKTGQAVRIVLVIRDLLDQVPSAYAQSVRFGHHTHDFDAYFAARSKFARAGHYAVAQVWADAFGWDALRVRTLNASDLRGGDLIADLLATAGLDPDAPPYRDLPRPGRLNASAGWKTLEAVRGYFAGKSNLAKNHPVMSILDYRNTEKPPKKAGIAAEAAGAELGWNKDKGLYLTREQADLCLETYAGWVRSLNANLTEKLSAPASLEARGFVEREFLPDHTHIPADELEAFYDGWGARLAERKSYYRRLSGRQG